MLIADLLTALSLILPMLSLVSPTWKELRHAYGPAEDIPNLIRAVAESEPTTASRRLSPWGEVWGRLCHQGDVYSATYAAVPHLVAIAERGSLEVRLEVLIFCGTVCLSAERLVGGPVPASLIESFDAAVETMKELSLGIAREAAAQDMLVRYPLPYLLQAILALRFGAESVVCLLDRLVEDVCEVEVECPECEWQMSVVLEELGSGQVDSSARGRELEEGVQLIEDGSGYLWSVGCVVEIAAALAVAMGDELLSARILGFRSSVACSSCRHQFRLSDAVLWGV